MTKYEELKTLAYRAKEILGSKLGDLNEIETTAYQNLQDFLGKTENKMPAFTGGARNLVACQWCGASHKVEASFVLNDQK